MIAHPSLVLHLDPKVRVAKEAKQLIEQRICKWKNRQFDVLLQSFLRCSKSMPKVNSQMNKADRERRFSKFVQNGSVRGAIALLTTADTKTLHPDDLVETVRGEKWETCLEVLRQKHPQAAPLYKESVSMEELPVLEQVVVTNRVVEETARRVSGSGGPSLANSKHWFDCLINYSSASASLRETVAKCASWLANTIVPWEKVSALFACRLIALEKKLGVRPIGIGETLRRILAKCLTAVVAEDFEDVIGSEQMTGGLKGGNEVFNTCN